MAFPVFSAGQRRTVQNWVGGGGGGGGGSGGARDVRGSRGEGAGGGRNGSSGGASGSGGSSGGQGPVVMPRSLAGYTAEQVKLICTTQVRDLISSDL